LTLPRILSFHINESTVAAQIRGNVNPYFGVYEEPTYLTTLEFEPISDAQWSAAIALMAAKAGIISRLLLQEIPENIEDTFAQLNLHLLPKSDAALHYHCSCPDWGDPCKHVAGLYYLIAAEIDRDPFLLFELRGLSRDKLFAELAKTPLGQVLSAELQLEQLPPQPVPTYFPTLKPTTADESPVTLRDFWQGAKRLPQTLEPLPQVGISGVAIKKQGDFPAFWGRSNSFLDAMETLYEQVKAKGLL
jgi:uncharacterized Zn finger protein